MKVAVVGPSGSGKTTLARVLARRFDAPHVQLDELLWGPAWTKVSPAIFDARVDEATQGPHWVVDGNHALGLERADAVVWLDFPLRLVLLRLARRTLRRMFTREPLWNGNRESLRRHLALFRRRDARIVLNEDNLFVWTITSHHPRRARWSDRLPKLTARVLRVRRPADLAAAIGELDGMDLITRGEPFGTHRA